MAEIKSSFKPEPAEIKALLIATFALTAALAAFYQTISITTILTLAVISATTLAVRELGQRIVAQNMQAYVELDTDQEGLSTTFLGAIIAAITGFGILLMFPIESKFSGRKYEHWGKSIDAIWAKRQFWLATGGIIALILVSTILFLMEFNTAAQIMVYFAFFQLLPFDFPMIPTGTLDGAYMLRWSGFMWTIIMGITIILMVVF